MSRKQPNRRHPKARRVVKGLGLLVLLAVVVSLVVRAIGNLGDGITAGEWVTTSVIAAFVAIVVIAAFLSELKTRYRWATRLDRFGAHVRAGAVTAYVAAIALGVYVVVLLAAFASGFNQWLVDRAPVVQALVVVALGAIAAAFLSLVLNRNRRQRFITDLVDRRFGGLYASAFLTVAASVALAAASAVLLVGADHSWWAFLAPGGGDPAAQVVGRDKLAEEALTSKLVLWETLDLVPVVELPRTLAWDDPPVTYDDWGVGFVLVAFKGFAGVALLATGKALLDAWAGRDDRRAHRVADSGAGSDTES